MSVLAGVLVLAGAAGAVWALDRIIADLRVGLYAVVAIGVLQTAVDVPEPEFGGIRVTINDLLFVFLMMALLARVLRGWSPSKMQLALVVLLSVVVYSVARGAMAFGVPGAVNEARATMYFLAVGLYASFVAADGRSRERVATAWFVYCWGLSSIALVRWLIVFGGLPGRGDWYDPTYGGLRVIHSNETLSVCIGFLMVLGPVLRGQATRHERIMLGVFGTVAVLLQHRSVIAVLLVSVAVMVWRHRSILSRSVVYGAGFVAIALGLVLVTVLDTGELASQASSADAGNTVTFEWRVQGWQVLLRDAGPSGPEETLLGKAYGSGYERVLPSGQRVDVFPHNMYLELLLRIGLVGVALYIAMGYAAWNRLRRSPPGREARHLDNSTLSVIVIAFSLYMIPYNLFTETGILLGLLMSAWDRVPLGATGQPVSRIEPHFERAVAVASRSMDDPV